MTTAPSNRWHPKPAYALWRPTFWVGQLDARPVSLFRITLGLVLLKDALYHIALARLFYSDAGVLPRQLLRDTIDYSERWSLLDYVGSPLGVQLFFALWAVVALLLIFGVRSRAMSVLSFVMLLSAVQRNGLIVEGSDAALVAFSFWALFLPLGAHFGWDSRRHTGPAPTAFALPVRALQIQIAAIYWFTGLYKLSDSAWVDGTALHYVLQLPTFLSPVGDWLQGWAPAGLLTITSWAVLLLELTWPLLIFWPWWQPRLRLWALLSGLLLHLSISAVMVVNNFSFIMLAAYPVLLVPAWLDALAQRRGFSWLRADTTAVATAPPRWRKALVTMAVLGMGFCIVWVNLRGLLPRVVPPVGGMARTALLRTSTAQKWTMFIIGETPTDTHLVARGAFSDGSELDLITNRPVSDEPTRWLLGPMTRWKTYEDAIVTRPQLLAQLAIHYCATAPQLDSVTLEQRRYTTQPPAASSLPAAPDYEVTVLEQFTCDPP